MDGWNPSRPTWPKERFSEFFPSLALVSNCINTLFLITFLMFSRLRFLSMVRSLSSFTSSVTDLLSRPELEIYRKAMPRISVFPVRTYVPLCIMIQGTPLLPAPKSFFLQTPDNATNLRQKSMDKSYHCYSRLNYP